MYVFLPFWGLKPCLLTYSLGQWLCCFPTLCFNYPGTPRLDHKLLSAIHPLVGKTSKVAYHFIGQNYFSLLGTVFSIAEMN